VSGSVVRANGHILDLLLDQSTRSSSISSIMVRATCESHARHHFRAATYQWQRLFSAENSWDDK
jgi:hypothetical protein